METVRLRKGDKSLLLDLDDLQVGARNVQRSTNKLYQMYLEQVNRVAAAFGVMPPVYLVKESDNTAIFPNDTTGRSIFSVGAVYDVYSSDGSGKSSTGGRMSSEPFGAYIGCTMCVNSWLEREMSCPLCRGK